MTSPLFAVLFSLVALSVPAVPPFEVVLIDGDFANGYHVTAGDIDSDSKPDIIALSERDAGYVAWYKNPTWEKFRITPETIRSPIDVLTADIDRDGDLDVVTVHDFLYSDETSLGGVSWLENTGRFQEPWPVHPIGYEPTLHRIRWIDLGGEGVSDILGAPIVGPGAKGPAYIGTTVRLEAYSAPADGSVHLWRERLIDDSLRLVHGLTVLDWDGDNRSDFMTASYEGITLFLNRPGGLERQRIGEGYRSEKGEQGSSEVERGHRAGNQPFVAAIEPRHGHQLVVYLPPKASERKESWQRLVIDDTFDTGHALACADLDGDGDDEIVAGYRGKGTSLFIYECVDPSGERWTRVPLDEGGMAANGCWVFDSDGDGDLDVVSTGGSTHNLKLYVNQTSH
jgi:hypothetical protein